MTGLSGRSRLLVRPPGTGQRGTGTISSIAAVAVFLGFMFFAVQLLFNLYATSVVTANGFDAARQVATQQDDETSVESLVGQAEGEARARMGSYADRVEFDWSGTDEDVVRLHLTTDNPRLLVFASGALPFTHLDRRIEVRVERFR